LTYEKNLVILLALGAKREIEGFEDAIGVFKTLKTLIPLPESGEGPPFQCTRRVAVGSTLRNPCES